MSKLSLNAVLVGFLAVVAVAALSGGIAMVVVQNRSSDGGVEIVLPTLTPTPELKVYVSGSVSSPGVYSLNPGDRVQDALEAAGGPSGDADLDCVNLALRVEDEGRYHFPGEEDGCKPPLGEAGSEESDGGQQTQGGLIDLNTASVDELKELPGIGDVNARAIVDHRELNGPFTDIEQVMEVSGIGPATFDGMKDLIVVGP